MLLAQQLPAQAQRAVGPNGLGGPLPWANCGRACRGWAAALEPAREPASSETPTEDATLEVSRALCSCSLWRTLSMRLRSSSASGGDIRLSIVRSNRRLMTSSAPKRPSLFQQLTFESSETVLAAELPALERRPRDTGASCSVERCSARAPAPAPVALVLHLSRDVATATSMLSSSMTLAWPLWLSGVWKAASLVALGASTCSSIAAADCETLPDWVARPLVPECGKDAPSGCAGKGVQPDAANDAVPDSKAQVPQAPSEADGRKGSGHPGRCANCLGVVVQAASVGTGAWQVSVAIPCIAGPRACAGCLARINGLMPSACAASTAGLQGRAAGGSASWLKLLAFSWRRGSIMTMSSLNGIRLRVSRWRLSRRTGRLGCGMWQKPQFRPFVQLPMAW
mmetsp:Transcript_43080/g.136978  ORF Transcript_43080/g.136978 Transcript_43080/m.136978 type:complete len:397 (+) Transcript_43080:88-1278(+)